MSNVIMMPDTSRRRRDPSTRQGDATILLFLGVRYVRCPEAPEDDALPPMPADAVLPSHHGECAIVAP